MAFRSRVDAIAKVRLTQARGAARAESSKRTSACLKRASARSCPHQRAARQDPRHRAGRRLRKSAGPRSGARDAAVRARPALDHPGRGTFSRSSRITRDAAAPRQGDHRGVPGSSTRQPVRRPLSFAVIVLERSKRSRRLCIRRGAPGRHIGARPFIARPFRAAAEKGDWGAGTTGGSSWMIHGGPRYLEFDWAPRAFRPDAGYSRVDCAGTSSTGRLHHPRALMTETTSKRMRRRWSLRPLQPLKKAHPHTRSPQRRRSEAEPGLTRDLIGAGDDGGVGRRPHRLVYAKRRGRRWHTARALLNHTKVVDLIRDGGKVIGVRYRLLTARCLRRGLESSSTPQDHGHPKSVAWPACGEAARRQGDPHRVPRIASRTFQSAPSRSNGRDLLMVSHAGFTLLGTTDDDFYWRPRFGGRPSGRGRVSVSGFRARVPTIRSTGRRAPPAAVRPTLYKWPTL